MMTRSLRLLDIHGSRKSWKKVFRNCLNTEPGSGDCTGEDILFLSGVVLQSQVEHYGITALKRWLPYVHFYDTDFFSPRSIWGIFLKTFPTESDYEVDSERAGDPSPSARPLLPSLHGMLRNAQAEETRTAQRVTQQLKTSASCTVWPKSVRAVDWFLEVLLGYAAFSLSVWVKFLPLLYSITKGGVKCQAQSRHWVSVCGYWQTDQVSIVRK